MISFSIYILLIIACLAAYQLNKQYLPRYLRYLQYILAISVIFEVVAEVLWHYNINNYFLDHLYQPVELILMSVLYYHAVGNEYFRGALKVIVPITVIASIIWSIAFEGLTNLNTGSFIMGSMLVITYSVIYKYQLFTSPPTKESLLVNPFFWINTANLFFYCGTFFQMGLQDYISKTNPVLAERLHIIINHGLNYTMHILYLIGFLCKRIFKPYSSL